MEDVITVAAICANWPPTLKVRPATLRILLDFLKRYAL
jgi:hypothetical protein